jgi:hypothetical protein
MLLGADSGGSFTVAPSLGLTLWTVFVIVVTALLLYLLVLLAIYLRRELARKS